jgi:hypothetical protein
VLEVSAKLGRHFWQRPAATLKPGQWDQLPDRLGLRPDDLAEQADLLAALRRAVDSTRDVSCEPYWSLADTWPHLPMVRPTCTR